MGEGVKVWKVSVKLNDNANENAKKTDSCIKGKEREKGF